MAKRVAGDVVTGRMALVVDGRTYVGRLWWISLFPGIAITLVSLSLNLLGDWLRDLLDPKLRNI